MIRCAGFLHCDLRTMSTRSWKKATDYADVNLKLEFDEFRKDMVDELRKLRDSVNNGSDTCDEVKRTNKDV